MSDVPGIQKPPPPASVRWSVLLFVSLAMFGNYFHRIPAPLMRHLPALTPSLFLKLFLKFLTNLLNQARPIARFFLTAYLSIRIPAARFFFKQPTPVSMW